LGKLGPRGFKNAFNWRTFDSMKKSPTGLHESPIAVVYPTCGRPEFLQRSIESLLCGTSTPAEVVVVDQSGQSETAQMLERIADSRIVHVLSSERGLSRARNLGLSSSKSPIVAFLDDDCLPPPFWIENARALMKEEPGSSIWAGTVVYDDRYLRQPENPFMATVRGGRDPWRYDPTGGNSFIRRELFDRIGLYDPLLGQGSSFPGAEDGDLVFRALDSGMQITYSNRLRCFHIPWRKGDEKLQNRFNYGSGVGAFLAKHSASGNGTIMAYVFARHFLKKLLKVPYHRIVGPRNEYDRAMAYSRGLIAGFRGWRKQAAASTPEVGLDG